MSPFNKPRLSSLELASSPEGYPFWICSSPFTKLKASHPSLLHSWKGRLLLPSFIQQMKEEKGLLYHYFILHPAFTACLDLMIWTCWPPPQHSRNSMLGRPAAPRFVPLLFQDDLIRVSLSYVHGNWRESHLFSSIFKISLENLNSKLVQFYFRIPYLSKVKIIIN